MDKKKFYSMLLVLVALIWGLGFPITNAAFENGLAPSHVITGRFALGAILMAVIFRKKFKQLTFEHIKFASLNGTFLFLLYFFQIVGQANTTAAKAAFITQMVVIIVPFINFFVVKEPITKKILATVAISFTGIYFLSFYGNDLGNIALGDFLMLLCAFFSACNAVMTSRTIKTKGYDPILYTTLLFIVAAVLSFGFALVDAKPLPTFSVQNYWPIVFLGVFNTVVGFVIYSFALTKLSANVAAVIVAGESLFAAIASVILGLDALTVNFVVGGLLIFSSIVFANINFEKKKATTHIEEIKKDSDDEGQDDEVAA